MFVPSLSWYQKDAFDIQMAQKVAFFAPVVPQVDGEVERGY